MGRISGAGFGFTSSYWWRSALRASLHRLNRSSPRPPFGLSLRVADRVSAVNRPRRQDGESLTQEIVKCHKKVGTKGDILRHAGPSGMLGTAARPAVGGGGTCDQRGWTSAGGGWGTRDVL